MRVAVLLVILAACSKNTEQCRVEAEALGTLLRDTPHEMSVFQPQRDVTLVKRTDVPVAPIPEGDVVVINPAQMIFRGEPVGDGLLAQRFDEIRERRGTRLYLQIDQATPWEKVVGAVNAAIRARFAYVGFAFATDAKLTPAGRSKIDDKLDALEASEASNKAVEFAKLAEDVIEGCPALKREFGKVGGEPAESKADVLIRGIPPALIECNCNLDMAAFRSMMWRLLAVDPSIQVIAIDPKAGATLALPRAMTWAEASKRLTPTTKAAQLVAE